MSALLNKVAIVTGASSGIGYATAKLFAHEQAGLIVTARRRDKLDALVAEITETGGRAIAVAGDIRDEGLQQELVTRALGHFGRLDIAFNNPGTTGEPKPLPELCPADWHEILDTNLTSAFLAAKYQLPALQKNGGGSVIFTSSFVGYSTGLPGMAAYAATKAGLVGLVRCLAVEYGNTGIRVNALLPGGTDTPMGQNFANTPEILAFVKNMHTLKRIARPQEIAQSALFLASDASSFTTGTTLFADGGVSINKT